MDTSLFLAQLLGIYFVLISVVVLIRQRSISGIIDEMAKSRLALFSLGLIELVAGLGIVLAYPQISMDHVGVISLIGYILVIESIIYLLIPAKMTKKIISKFNKPLWYSAGGVLGLAGGLYLAGIGFGIIS